MVSQCFTEESISTIAIGVRLGEIFFVSRSRAGRSLKKIEKVFPSLKDLRQTFLPCVGNPWFLLGLLPGCNPAVTAFLSYDIEKKVSRHPERFGKGALEV
jgi:putative tricarboxylic transport membrane protein